METMAFTLFRVECTLRWTTLCIPQLSFVYQCSREAAAYDAAAGAAGGNGACVSDGDDMTLASESQITIFI